MNTLSGCNAQDHNICYDYKSSKTWNKYISPGRHSIDDVLYPTCDVKSCLTLSTFVQLQTRMHSMYVETWEVARRYARSTGYSTARRADTHGVARLATRKHTTRSSYTWNIKTKQLNYCFYTSQIETIIRYQSFLLIVHVIPWNDSYDSYDERLDSNPIRSFSKIRIRIFNAKYVRGRNPCASIHIVLIRINHLTRYPDIFLSRWCFHRFNQYCKFTI